MNQQMEDDLCQHLGERLQYVIKDHLDTCDRVDVDPLHAVEMALGMLLRTAKEVLRTEGGTDKDLMRVCLFILQGGATAQ